jgi:multiple sugar transport system substrate-binding protein
MVKKRVWRVAVAMAIVLLSAPSIFAGPGAENGVSAKESVTLRVSDWRAEAQLTEYHAWMEEFEEENGITIETEVTPFAEYFTKLQTTAAAGIAPDLWNMSSAFLPQLAELGIIRDIGDLVDKDPRFSWDDFHQVAVDECFYKSVAYRLPIGLYPAIFYYNKSMFDEAGLDYPNDDWTWDDLREAAIVLTDDTNGDDIVDQWGFLVSKAMQVGWSSFIWQNGGEMINEDKTRALIDQPEAIEAIQFLVDLMNKYKVSPGIEAADQLGDPFLTGQVAMAVNGVWKLNAYSAIEDFEWDIAMLPKQNQWATSSIGGGYTIFRDTDYPDEAFEVMKFITDKSQSQKSAGIPAKITSMDLYFEWWNNVPNIAAIGRMIKHGHTLDITLGWNEWVRAAETEVSLALLGNKTAAEAARDAAKAINEVLADQ